MIAESMPMPRSERSRFGARLALGIAAVAIVAVGVGILAWWFAAAAPALPSRNPFGAGVREAAPSPGGFGSLILAMQGTFYRNLQGALTALKESGTAFWSLIGLGFAYGVFHAAGPGHGKAVIAAYLVSGERTLTKGFAMSLAAALVQALVAIALVGSVTLVLRSTAATMAQVTNLIEITSFAAVAALGALLVWRKAGKVLEIVSGDPALHVSGHGPECAGCSHLHFPRAKVAARSPRWRETAGVVVAAGLRPCAGALVVLVFSLSQGLFAAGIAATFAMALGTALTTGAIAALAVFARALAVRMAGGRGASGALAIAGAELLAAAFVLVLGASLLAGLWTGSGAS